MYQKFAINDPKALRQTFRRSRVAAIEREEKKFDIKFS